LTIEAARLPATTQVVAAGAEALSNASGRPCALNAPVELGGSARSLVLRAAVDGGPATVILKAYGADDRGSFLDEAAGLAFCDAGPLLLAADPAMPLVVLEDLGSHPSLADLLLGSDADAALRAGVEWAREFGRLCAASAGREPEFAALRQGLGGEAANPDHGTWLAHAFAQLPELFGQWGVELPPGLDAEFGELLPVIEPGEFAVFSPGDVCPDNNMFTPDGLRFLDFESAGYHSVFLDAAYTRLPFATCWCVYTPPPGLTAALEAAFRGELLTVFPALADDACWDRGLRRACAAWVLSMSVWLLPRAVEGGAALVPAGRPAPSRRPYLAHRWRWLAAELERAGEFPAICGLLRRAIAHAQQAWGEDALVLGGYPAFRREPRGRQS
jgi:hypothetical protein